MLLDIYRKMSLNTFSLNYYLFTKDKKEKMDLPMFICKNYFIELSILNQLISQEQWPRNDRYRASRHHKANILFDL